MVGRSTPDGTAIETRTEPDSPASQPSQSASRSRRRLLLVAAVVAMLVVTAVLAFQWGSAGRTEGPGTARPSPSPSRDQPLTVAQLYERLAPSVVSIRAAPGGGTGTGVIVNADGTILTALHVVQGAQSIEVTFADGTRSAAEIVNVAMAIDIALLATATLPEVVVPAVLGGGVAIGDDVVAIGNQLGLSGSTTAGVVSGLERTIGREGGGSLSGLIQFDAAVNPGSSGGPLVNTRGETVGIVVALANPTDAGTFIGIGFAVPIGAAVTAGGTRVPQR